MSIPRFLVGLVLVGGFVLPFEGLWAALDAGRLEVLQDQNDPAFKESARAFAEAVEFSTRQTPNRSKLAGNLKFYFEGGVNAFDVDDKTLITFTDSSADPFVPDSFENFFFKAGTGLPYGFAVDAGVSQVFTEHKLTAIHTNIAFQAMDFANLVYTDMIPSLAVTTGFNMILSGPSQFSFNTQAILGAYHRLWMAQVNYILSVSWVHLNALQPTYRTWFIRHGLSSYWPLFEGIFLTTTMYYKPIEAGVSLGYQF